MGTYDVVKVKCPHCGKSTTSRTKELKENRGEVLGVGSVVVIDTGVFQLKNPCKHCGEKICLRIKYKLIEDVLRCDHPDFIEGVFGEVFSPAKKKNRKRLRQ